MQVTQKRGKSRNFILCNHYTKQLVLTVMLVPMKIRLSFGLASPARMIALVQLLQARHFEERQLRGEVVSGG